MQGWSEVWPTRARILLATFWAGSLWTVGYLVAPTLFATLSDRVLTGTIAASLFRAQAWVSVCCALFLVAMLPRRKEQANLPGNKALLGLIIAMLVCAVVIHFGLQPFMASLREAAGSSGVMNSDQRAQFGILHGISSVIYLIESVLALFLVLKIR
ncbi:MAG: DUF4149 domain-containing protein [Pseudomonadota bacterium]